MPEPAKDKDKSAKWLIEHHGDAILRLGGVTDLVRWQAAAAELVLPTKLPDGLLFAWRAVRHVPSNAIVLARNLATVGIGGGQTSRLAALEIALHRASDRAKLSCLASDAYFPFADAIQLAAERGVTAIIQPGGSSRDEMAIEVADRHHMAMVFTGRRHFRH